MPIVKKVRKLGARSGLGAGPREASSARPVFVASEAPCAHGCPNATDVRGFLTALARGDSPLGGCAEAFRIITEANPLPGVCGWLCPHHCEDGCNRAALDGPVAVNALERAVAATALEEGWALRRLTPTGSGTPVTVIGAGAAGLSAAYQLARRGYAVTLCDPADEPGGELRYAVEADRLPRAVLDAEIARILDLGVAFAGRTVPVDADAAAGSTAGSVGPASRPPGIPAQAAILRTRLYEPGQPAVAAAIPAAIRFGRHAAEALDAALRGTTLQPAAKLPRSGREHLRLEHYARQPRSAAAALGAEEAVAEAKRCLCCGACLECDNCWKYCPDQAVIKPLERGQPYRFRLDYCQGCRKCAEQCPTGYIEMR